MEEGAEVEGWTEGEISENKNEYEDQDKAFTQLSRFYLSFVISNSLPSHLHFILHSLFPILYYLVGLKVACTNTEFYL